MSLFSDEQKRRLNTAFAAPLGKVGGAPLVDGGNILDAIEQAVEAADATVQAAADAAQAAADAAQADIDAIVSGQATILNGNTSIAVTLGAAYNGKKAVVSFGEAPTAATLIYAADVSGGDLTISIDQDNTADLKVNYILDAR